MTTHNERIQRLVDAIEYLWPKVQPKLEQRKREGKILIDRDDFVWQVLLNSMSTWGRFRYGALMNVPEIYNTVSYEGIAKVVDSDREHVLREAFDKAGLRFHTDKARYMAVNYNLIQKKGGAVEAKQEYLAKPDKDAKMRFWKEFNGIGKKYARNIPMDIYDEHFRDEVALDARLIGIATELGFTDKEARSYDVMTPYFRDVAATCNMEIELWDIDRILFNYAACVNLTLES